MSRTFDDPGCSTLAGAAPGSCLHGAAPAELEPIIEAWAAAHP